MSELVPIRLGATHVAQLAARRAERRLRRLELRRKRRRRNRIDIPKGQRMERDLKCLGARLGHAYGLHPLLKALL